MSRPTHLLPIALFAAYAPPAFAETDFQQWVGFSARIGLSETVSVQNEFQVRFSDDRGGLFQIQNATLLAYKVAPDVTIAAGYLHSPSYVRGDFASMERRAREQVTFDNIATLGTAKLSARLRTEQRWRDDLSGTGWRVRPYVRLAVPLGGKTAPTLNLTEEVFVNLNTTAFQSVGGLERVRSTAALSIPLSEVVRLETGYLNQHRFVRGGEDLGEHALTASMALSF